MNEKKIHLPSALFGAIAGSAILATIAFAPKEAAEAEKGARWELKVVTDPAQADVDSLNEDGWEYAGYLGRNSRGQTNDDVLFRRSAR